MTEPQFCLACGVSTDLHPDRIESTIACGIAARKAELMERWLAGGSLRPERIRE